MSEKTEKSAIPLPKGCELVEVLQYQCEIGMSQVICNPFVRIFAKCKGFPLYEVTPPDNSEDLSNTRIHHVPSKPVVEDLKTPPGVVAAEADNP